MSAESINSTELATLATPLSAGERSEPKRSGVASVARRAPDPEVTPHRARRTYSAQYKATILAEVDRCNQPGQVGAILRRERLIYNHLAKWRQLRKAGRLDASATRGPQPQAADPAVAALTRENARLQRKLRQAEQVIEFQKKVSELLGLGLGVQSNEDESEAS